MKNEHLHVDLKRLYKISRKFMILQNGLQVDEILKLIIGASIPNNFHNLDLCIFKLLSLPQKEVILTKKSNQKGPHLDKCKRNHPINLVKSISTCFA